MNTVSRIVAGMLELLLNLLCASCAKCSVPKAHNVKAQGNALGTCETKDQSPTGATP